MRPNQLIRNVAILLLATLLVGCMGWSDFMKHPPGLHSMLSKPGKTKQDMFADLQACSDEARDSGIQLARDRRIRAEACMLNKGYIFTYHRPKGYADYCSKDFFGGGPACKSVGR